MRLIWVFLLWAMPLWAEQAADGVAPEAAAPVLAVSSDPAVQTALAAKAAGVPVEAREWMIAAAHPLAVEAGASVLKAGGTAADAMIAVQAVLGLVEPQSSGLGGGAFLLWHDGATGEITSLDGRETAPFAATPRLFQTGDGKPMGFWDAVIGGRSVGVPGVPALLEAAHRRWGKQPWESLLAPAIDLAEGGFTVSPRLAALVAADQERLAKHPETARYFLPEGLPIAEGARLTNPAYAATLREMARAGATAFYATGEGGIGHAIVEAVRGVPDNPGALSELDLAAYGVRERAAVCAPYRQYEVCGMGPPSSGGVTVGQILGMLGGFDLSALGPESAEAWRLIGDASRLAFADRERFLADEDFTPVPVQGLLDPAYLAERAGALRGEKALPSVEAGKPKWTHAGLRVDGLSLERPSTTHISIVDRYGNALSMTSSIENAFGSRVMVRGFLLNNQLTDFSFATHREGARVANHLEPGKRPRSSMAPTIVRESGKPVLVIGSPGGSRIIGYVAQTVIAWADWGMDVQAAVAMPHLVNRFGRYELEAGTSALDLAPALEAIGFETRGVEMTSGLHAIEIGEAGLFGGADPRREGIALGQ